MRILFITNYYQVGYGGEEQSCYQVVEGLNQRQHQTLVLTSRYRADELKNEDGVSRSLFLEMDLVPWRNSITFFTSHKAKEQKNLQCLESAVSQFEPDVIFIWGMWNLHKSLAGFAEARYPDKVAYRFATYWPTLPSQHETYWRTPGRNWYSRIIKRSLGKFALQILDSDNSQPALTFKNCICVSAATREELVKAGVPVAQARIIYTGLDVERFSQSILQPVRSDDAGLDLLYVGRIAPDKGIETAIFALRTLVFDHGIQGIRLSLVGSGHRDYENQLHRLVEQENLTAFVDFLGWHSPDQIPELMCNFDMLLLPSTWPEPFARVLAEGMISGLVVVATAAGGTPEIVVDGENGFLFRPNDSEDLVQKILQVKDDPGLRRKVIEAGRKTVLDKFTTAKMVDEVEDFLHEVASNISN